MRGYKEEQYLVFMFDNGKTVKYDLANHTYIGKMGKPVKSFQSQFAGLRVDDVLAIIEDTAYKAFLTYINNETRSYTVQALFENIKDFSNLEPFFQQGIKGISGNFPYTIKQVPKGLLKLAKEQQFVLNTQIVDRYKETPQEIEKIFSVQFNTLTTEQIFNMLQGWYSSSFTALIKEYRYDCLALIRYLDNMATYEGLEDTGNLVRNLHDYAKKMSGLTNGDYTKYPKNFLTQHHITKRNYERFAKEFPEELFQKRRNKKLEFEFEGFRCIYPENAKAIQQEGADQSHCVASYVNRVLEGEGHVIFLRRSNCLTESLITLYVVNGELSTALGKHNRQPNAEEKPIIKAYKEYLATI